MPLLFLAFTARAQYYLRGEVKDEKNQPLQNVKILLHSNNHYYFSGTGGGFGITTNLITDSLTLNLDGYEPLSLSVNSEKWQYLTLKISPSKVNKNRPKLISVTKNLEQTSRIRWYINDETYFQLIENEYVNSYKFPNTGFSLNVNKASYSNVRRFLNRESIVPPDAVRTEEMVNYFNLHYREPENDRVFSIGSQLTSCPWNLDRQLLILNINAKKLNLNMIPPGNFVFLIDASGSMDMPNKLPLLKSAFQMLVKNLRPIDTISIVTYGGTVGVLLQPTGGAEKEKILKAIETLSASGDTNGEAAIMTAYALARSTFKEGGSNRVILATDGDFNVGLTSEKALEDLITKERQRGIYLTCLGVGTGNLKDSKLASLANKGNGNYAYLDDVNEAEKVLVKELTQTFYAVADDVFLNLKFNANLVKEYRLIGFDNRRDAVADTLIDLDGGEIGSANSVLAIFEIMPATDKLFNPDILPKDKVAELDMRYSLCNDTVQLLMTDYCPANFVPFQSIDSDLRFATAVAMFGLKLKQSKFIKQADWMDIYQIAAGSYDPNSFLQTEFLQLVEKARNIYASKKQRKKKRD
ncbi:MAG: von Willebrand factor type A domain-containing protein [Chitinophagaceae bacterium]|nr:von Willebrand factor type A domain-containing protein [Chitinophagaceae bacterium]